MALTKEHMKSLLIRDNGFLRELYEGQNPIKNKQLLLYANDSQLVTLLKFLYFLSNGLIKIKKENFEKLPLRKLNLLKKTVEKQTKLYEMINSDRKVKTKFLLQFVNCYDALLDCLFIY